MKIKVKECIVSKTGEKDGRPWTIYRLTTEEGINYSCFTKIDPGEHEGTIKESSNPAYDDTFSPAKKRGGFGINYEEEKKMKALECTVQLACHGKIEINQLESSFNKLIKYLK